jgi:hypothetical protein
MELSAALQAFLGERHLATLATLRADGSPTRCRWVLRRRRGLRITEAPGQTALGDGRAAVTQVDGARWVSLDGPARVVHDPAVVAAAVDAYSRRYRQPRERDDRVVIEIEVQRMMCNSGLR